MKRRPRRQLSDSLPIALLLALVGGLLDAYTYLTRGHVFANAQTGNIVLMGLSAARGEWDAVARTCWPVLAYALGVAATLGVEGRFKTATRRLHWRQIAIGAEIAALIVAACLPYGRADGWANLLVAFVCSLQVQAFRFVRGAPYASTMCTGNLRSGTEWLWRYAHTRRVDHLRQGLRYFGVILLFIAGAALGAWAAAWRASAGAWIAVGLLALVFALLFLPAEDS